MLLQKSYSLKLLIVGVLLFSASLYASNQYVQAKSLGYKWYNPGNTITFKTGFNDTWTTPLSSAVTTWNNVSTKVPMAISSAAAGADDSTITSINDTSQNWIAKMFPTNFGLQGSTYIRKVDIKFNLRYSFSVGATAGKYDIQSVGTHEFGHAIGIAHCHEDGDTHGSSDSTYTMYPNSFTNSTIARSLTTYDSDAKNDIYG